MSSANYSFLFRKGFYMNEIDDLIKMIRKAATFHYTKHNEKPTQGVIAVTKDFANKLNETKLSGVFVGPNGEKIEGKTGILKNGKIILMGIVFQIVVRRKLHKQHILNLNLFVKPGKYPQKTIVVSKAATVIGDVNHNLVAFDF